VTHEPAPDTRNLALSEAETAMLGLPRTDTFALPDIPECPCGRTTGPCICSACSLTTDDAIARYIAAFTEWDRRYREEPERFEAESVRLLKGTPETYGDAAAPYFARILDEQAHGR
jgi:hypothetical protein